MRQARSGVAYNSGFHGGSLSGLTGWSAGRSGGEYYDLYDHCLDFALKIIMICWRWPSGPAERCFGRD